MISVLVLCTGNSARSILAEAAMNDPRIGAGKFRAFSAGSHPRGQVHPLALALLGDERVATDGLRSKSWEEFAGPDAPPLDVVITVCDQAAAEPCPIWPGAPVTGHWGIPDPAAVEGSDEQRRAAFRAAWAVLRRRIERLAAEPLDELSPAALQQRLTEIGREVNEPTAARTMNTTEIDRPS